MPTDASGREALLPCPFCGGEGRTSKFTAAVVKVPWRALCMNDDCPMSLHCDFETEAEAIAAWNTRPATQQAPAAADVERLRELLAKATPGPWTNHGTFYGHVVNGPTSGIALDVPERDAILIVAMHEALPALLASPTVSNEIVVGAGTYVEHGTVTGRTEISLPPGTLLVTAAQIVEVMAAWDGVKSSYGWDEEETFDRMNTALRGVGLLLKESS